MRSLMPVGVTGLTVSQLEQRAIDEGSLYPRGYRGYPADTANPYRRRAAPAVTP